MGWGWLKKAAGVALAPVTGGLSLMDPSKLDPTNINKFRAHGATLDTRQYNPDIGQAQQNVQQLYGQQQGLADLLNQQGMGQGPNPALEMLRQQTGQNVMQAQGLAASQRGVNPAMRAMMGGQFGAQANQQAAGQGAILSAQQQLAARQQLSALLAAMGAQQQGMYGAAGQLQQGQNMANIANVLGPQQINAGVAAQNAQNFMNMLGGAMQGAGAFLGLAGGGEVPGYRWGGTVGGSLFDDLDAMSPGPWATMDQAMPPAPMPQPFPMAPVGPAAPEVTRIGGVTTPPAPVPEAASKWGGALSGAGQNFMKPTMGDFDRFMNMRVVGSPLAQGGMAGLPDYRGGGPIPGSAPYPGNDERNDTVHIAASPGEIVIPRTVAQGPDAPEKARNFVEHLMQHQGLGYDHVLKSRKKYQEGGRVKESEPEPSLWEAVKGWWATKGGTSEAQAKGKDVAEAINAALPPEVSGRQGLKAQRKRQDEAYEASKSE